MTDDTADAPQSFEGRPPGNPKKRRTHAQTRKLLKQARDRFKQGQSAEEQQRERELADLAFYGNKQWPEDILASRAGMEAQNGMPPVPARPSITINKTREPVRSVLNQERGSETTIEIVPADDFGELIETTIAKDEIALREGLARRIQRESKAADARTWAFARAVIAGRGYYGVMTRYCEGKTFDKEIYIHRYYNQSCVLLDPAHEQPDGSDAEWEFIGTDMPLDAYKAEYGLRNGRANRFCETDLSDGDWRQLGEEQPGWFTGDGDERKIRVVDYLYTVRKARQLVELIDGTAVWGDELPPGFPDEQINDERTVIEKQLKWCKIDGCDDDVLEETDWEGPDMPIVKVVGEELQPYDDERRTEGMVRPMREPGQSYNVMVSKMVELVGLAPMAPLMMAEGQDEGYTEWYNAANTRTLPYLPYKQTDLEGRPAVPPFSAPRDAPIGPVTQAIALFDDAIQATSAVSDPALGQTDSSVNSAKHATLLREQARQATSNYLDNLQRSMRYEAQIINNLLYPIYGRRKGRIARIINGQGEAETLMIGHPMVSQDGRPQKAADGDPNAKTYALTKDAKFNAIAKITKNFDSRRDQESQTVGELISASPNLLTVFGDLYFKNLDGPGHDEMAERMKVMLDPKVLQLLESKKSGSELPPEVQAKMAQGQQQIEQLQQQLQQATQAIQAKTVEEQAETARIDKKLAADLEMARIDADKALQIEAMKQRTALTIEEWKLTGTRMQQEMDAIEAERDRQSGVTAQTGQQAHEAGMAAMGAAATSGENEQARAVQQQGQQSDQDHAMAMQADAQRAAAEQAAVAAQQQENQQ